MNPTICSRCNKNVAVIFITKYDPQTKESKNEGLCLKCARELRIKPIDDIMNKIGLTDDDVDNLSGEFSNAMQGIDEMVPADGTENDEEGHTATFPLLKNLFSNMQNNAAAQGQVPNQGADNTANRPDEKKDARKQSRRKFLDSFCINLTERALQGKLDSMIGREEELERVIQILNRRQKNNPCLIGEPGVGKTAIAEGLAQRIADGNVPAKLQDKQVFLLDLTALVAGTQFRGTGYQRQAP